ncbi:ankyrin repeat domain-containing protein [Thermodesulfobacteriota bacterium]
MTPGCPELQAKSKFETLAITAGETALPELVSLAKKNKRLDFLKRLKDCDKQLVNQAGGQGETALMWWACHGDAEMVAILLKKGADVHKADWMDCTALLYAALACKPSAAKLLVNAGASVNSANSAGQTPIKAAARCKGTELVGLLKASLSEK